MSQYDLHYNFDDIFLRNVIVGFINLTHENVRWYMQTGRAHTERREVRVPFYFSTTGSERYLQDNFLNDMVTDPANEKAEGTYDLIPRGILNLTGMSVVTNEITNKYVRVERTRMQDDGSLKTFSVETFWVPIEMEFECTIHVDSMADQLKCTEASMAAFYKHRPFQVDLVSMRIPAVAFFSEKYENDRTFDYKFEDKKSYTVKYPVTVKTSFPIFLNETEVFRGNRIDTFSSSITVANKDGLGATAKSTSHTGGPTGPVLPIEGPVPGSTASLQYPEKFVSDRTWAVSWPVTSGSPVHPSGGATGATGS